MGLETWQVEVRFKGRVYSLVGKCPQEKRNDVVNLPRKVDISTKAKLTALPSKGFFCKFHCKNDSVELTQYLSMRNVAICVSFPCRQNRSQFTLHLLLPDVIQQLKSFHRLVKNNPKANLESLTAPQQKGIFIGLLSQQPLEEFSQKLKEKTRIIRETASKAKAISSTIGDPMLEFEILLDRLSTSQSAIDVVVKFIIRHRSKIDQIASKLLDTINEWESSKARLNIVYAVHESMRKVIRDSQKHNHKTNSSHNSQCLKESDIYIGFESCNVFYSLIRKVKVSKQTKHLLDEVLKVWSAWGIDYTKNPDPDSNLDNGNSKDTLPKNPSPALIEENELTKENPGIWKITHKFNLSFGAWYPIFKPASEDILSRIYIAIDLFVTCAKERINHYYHSKSSCNISSNLVKHSNSSNDDGISTAVKFFLRNFLKQAYPMLLSITNRSALLEESESKLLQSSEEKKNDILRESFLASWKFEADVFSLIRNTNIDPFHVQKIWNCLEELWLSKRSTAPSDSSSNNSQSFSSKPINLIQVSSIEKPDFKPSAYVTSKLQQWRLSNNQDKILDLLGYIKKRNSSSSDSSDTSLNITYLKEKIKEIWCIDFLATESLNRLKSAKHVAQVAKALAETSIATGTSSTQSSNSAAATTSNGTTNNGISLSNPSSYVMTRVLEVEQEMFRLQQKSSDSKEKKRMFGRFALSAPPQLRECIKKALKADDDRQASTCASNRKRKRSQMSFNSSSDNSSNDSSSDEEGEYLTSKARRKKKKDLTSIEEYLKSLEVLRETLPKPPALKFLKCTSKGICLRERNKGGVLAVHPSGIENAGNGLFNYNPKVWPALSVVCVFGKRRISKEMHHDEMNKVSQCGQVGETFVVVNEKVLPVETFQAQYGKRLLPYDGLIDAEGSIGGYPNDRVYEFDEKIYWDASGIYNNTIIVPGCLIDEDNPDEGITLDQLYLVTWKDVQPYEEFFLAYGTSYYEEDEKVD